MVHFTNEKKAKIQKWLLKLYVQWLKMSALQWTKLSCDRHVMYMWLSCDRHVMYAKKFVKQYGLTSSLKYPQANVAAEWAVKAVKQLQQSME